MEFGFQEAISVIVSNPEAQAQRCCQHPSSVDPPSPSQSTKCGQNKNVDGLRQQFEASKDLRNNYTTEEHVYRAVIHAAKTRAKNQTQQMRALIEYLKSVISYTEHERQKAEKTCQALMSDLQDAQMAPNIMKSTRCDIHLLITAHFSPPYSTTTQSITYSYATVENNTQRGRAYELLIPCRYRGSTQWLPGVPRRRIAETIERK